MRVIRTNDGSSSIFLPEMNETYHSKFGAVTESLHVFIKSGLRYHAQNDLNILEIGFGTGLNVFLSLIENISGKRTIYFESIEKFPLHENIINQLNFLKKENQSLFRQVHDAPWNKEVVLRGNFILHKRELDLLNFQSEKRFDLVYFDAFAPNKQPEMWTNDVFENIYKHMNIGGVLVTYSAKGSVRRTMESVGFIVERIQGPPGKREMLRAKKL